MLILLFVSSKYYLQTKRLAPSEYQHVGKKEMSFIRRQTPQGPLSPRPVPEKAWSFGIFFANILY